MAILHAISSKILPIILLFTRISTKESEICQAPPLGNCFSKCYEECKLSAENENDELKLENILMAKHMCDSKCRSEIIPVKKIDVNDNNVLQCIGICKQPMPEHCKSGYLAKFFYCDCLSCCKKLGESKVLSCQDGCYEYFGRLDEDIYSTQVCKFHSDFAGAKSAWCQAWCVWKLNSLNIMPIHGIPMLKDALVTRCTSRCAGFVAGGAKVDYSTKVPIKCSQESDYWNCLTSAKLLRIEVGSFSDEDIKSLPGLGSAFNDKKTLSEENKDNGIPNHEATYTRNLQYKLKVQVKPSWSPTLKFIKENGGPITGPDSIEIKSDSKRSAKVPWDKLSPLIREAFEKANRNGGVASAEFAFNVRVVIKTMYCTAVKADVRATLKEMKVQTDFYANVSDAKSMIPLGAEKLKQAVQNNFQLKGLTYIQNVNDFVIQVKGTMTVDITFPDFSVVFEKCSKGNGCRTQTGWTASSACWFA